MEIANILLDHSTTNQYGESRYKTYDDSSYYCKQSSSSLSDIWSYGYLLDKIFNDLMDCQGTENGIKINKYILQARDKFNYIRLKSPEVKFCIYIKDFKEDTTKHLELYVSVCNSKEQVCHKLDGIITEVIALVYREARPLILSTIKYGDPVWVERAINEIRSTISYKWRFV